MFEFDIFRYMTLSDNADKDADMMFIVMFRTLGHIGSVHNNTG